MKNKILTPIIIPLFTLSSASAAILTSFDVVGSISGGSSSPISGLSYGTDESGNPDSVKDTSSSVSGARNDDNGLVFTYELDLINYNGGAPQMGADGIYDTRILVTTSGLSGTHDYRSAFFTTSSTIGSRLGNHKDSLATNPVPTTGTVGVAGATYSGLDLITQTIEIQFINQIEAKVSDMGAFEWSSTNTRTGNTNAYENTTIQLLGAGHTAFNASSAVNTDVYIEDRASVGYAAAGLFHANGDTQDGVGTSAAHSQDNTHPDYPLHDDDVTISGADAENASIQSDALTGIRFTQTMIDTRGDSDVNFDYTLSLISGSLTNITVVPEPSSTLLLGMALTLGVVARNRD